MNAFHLKLDELIRAVQGARTRPVSLEACSDEALEHLQRGVPGPRRRMSATDRGDDGDSDLVCRPRPTGPDPEASPDFPRPPETRGCSLGTWQNCAEEAWHNDSAFVETRRRLDRLEAASNHEQ